MSASTKRLQLPRVSPKSVPTSADLTHFICEYVTQLWNMQWQSLRSHNKLAQLKQLPTPWATTNMGTCRQEIVLTRLRIGHMRITHTRLISHLFPPHVSHARVKILFQSNTCSLALNYPTPYTHKGPHNHFQALANDSLSISHSVPYL